MALIWLILPHANRFTPWGNNCVCFLLLILVLCVVHVQEKVGSSSIFWQCTLLITSKSSAQGTSYIKQSIRTNMNTAHCKTSEKKITLAGFILYSIMQLLFQAYEERVWQILKKHWAGWCTEKLLRHLRRISCEHIVPSHLFLCVTAEDCTLHRFWTEH